MKQTFQSSYSVFK